MSVTIATLMVLVLYINDIPKEWMGHHENTAGKWVEMGMGGCLKMKRNLKRNGWKDSYTGKTRFRNNGIVIHTCICKCLHGSLYRMW